MLIAMFCTNVISIAVCIFFSDINEGAPSEEKKMVCKFLLNYINILEKTYL